MPCARTGVIAQLVILSLAAAAGPAADICAAQAPGCGANAGVDDSVELLQTSSAVHAQSASERLHSSKAKRPGWAETPSPPGAPSARTTEIIGATFPLRREDGLPLQPSLLEGTDILSLATHSTTRETCFQGSPRSVPGTLDQDGAEHLHSVVAATRDGVKFKLFPLDTKPETGNGMLCCTGTIDTEDEMVKMQCQRKPDKTSSLTEIPSRFIQTSLAGESGGSLAEAADQIARVVRAAPAGTVVLVSTPVLHQVLVALGDSDRQKVVEADGKIARFFGWILRQLGFNVKG